MVNWGKVFTKLIALSEVFLSLKHQEKAGDLHGEVCQGDQLVNIMINPDLILTVKLQQIKLRKYMYIKF